MPESANVRPAWKAALLTSLALTLLALFVQGQDANWDLRNYHFYTPSALMDGRFDDDIAAGQLQTWHNPTLDFPFAWMVRAGLPGWVVSLWLALPAFLALLFALRLLDLAWPTARSGLRTAMAGLAGVTGAAVMPSIGTTFNDASVAAGMLGALWWIVESQGRRNAWAIWLPAGLIAGAAAGLKLTGALYCIGLAGAVFVAGPLRGLPVRLVALAIGGIAGALITAGPWALYLWQEHGNPLFPYFNQWFHSPDAAFHAHKDARFVPHGWDAWLVPLHLLSDSLRFSESRLADPRLLLGGVALVIASLRLDESARRTRAMLLVFVVVSFVVWVKLYGIYRYLFVVELLCSMAVMGLASAWLPARFARIGLVLLALVLVGVTNRPGWGRASFSTPMIDVRLPALPADSLIVQAADQPLGYAAALLPRPVPAVSIRNNFMAPTNCTRLQVRAEQRVRTHAGPLYLLREPLRQGESVVPLPYGLSLDGACVPVPSNLGKLELCRLARDITSPAVCAPPVGR